VPIGTLLFQNFIVCLAREAIRPMLLEKKLVKEEGPESGKCRL